MPKKLTLLLATVACLIFAVPAMASAAAPTVQSSSGEILKIPTNIRLTGSDFIITSSTLGTITCEILDLNGSVTVNDTSNGWTASNSGESHPVQLNCKNGSNAVTVTSFKITDLKSTVNGTATFSFTTLIDIGPIACTFTGTNVSGSYANGGELLTFSNATGITGSPVNCGTGKLDASFRIETGTGTTLKFVFG